MRHRNKWYLSTSFYCYFYLSYTCKYDEMKILKYMSVGIYYVKLLKDLYRIFYDSINQIIVKINLFYHTIYESSSSSWKWNLCITLFIYFRTSFHINTDIISYVHFSFKILGNGIGSYSNNRIIFIVSWIWK